MDGLRILIVDDDADSAETMAWLLKHHGHAVEFVTDSANCLSAIESFSPDVLLLDIAMLKVSGYTLAEQIKNRPEFANVILLAVSGFSDPGHVQQSFQAGCDDHLIKPVDFDTLDTAIIKAIERRQAQNGASSGSACS